MRFYGERFKIYQVQKFVPFSLEHHVHCFNNSNNIFIRFSVLVQRFNAVLLHDSLPDRECTDY